MNKLGLKICLIYFTCISALFAFLIPPFEAPDEQFHLQYINFISYYKELPNQYEGIKYPDRYVGQGHQYPLYYIITGAINWVFSSDSRINYTLTKNNNHKWNGGTTGKVPLFDHVKNPPFHNNNNRIIFYLLRLLSVLMGAVNIFFIYKISEFIISDSRIRILPVIFAATLPQYIFVSSIINNDNLANLLSTISIYLILNLLKNPLNKKYYLRTGIILGLSLITKKTLFYLIPGIFIIYFYLFFSSGKNFAVLKQILISFLIVLLISSWYFIRNKVIYSDILALQMERSTMQSLIKEKSIFSFYFITPFSPSIVRSFIGVFGWMNLPLHISIYIVYLIPMLSSVAGLYRYLKSKDKQLMYVYSLILFFAICLGGIIYFNLTFTQSQGRYMFPVLSSISILFIIGITTIIKKYRISEIMIYIITVFFVITDLLSIFTLYNFYY